MKNASGSSHAEAITIGCQNAWSSHPLMIELAKHAPRIVVSKDDCGGLYKKLDQGELQYAFCSSISLVRNAEFEMALPVGISVEGSSGLAIWGLSSAQSQLKEVIDSRVSILRDIFKTVQITRATDLKAALSQAVDLLAKVPLPRLNSAPQLRLTTGASSWGTLSRITYKLIFGCESYAAMCRSPLDTSHPCIDFRVENEALTKRCSYSHLIDLSELWYRMTGLPFVSSVLQKKRKTCACRTSLSEASELAEMRMQVEPCNYLPDMLPRNCYSQSIDLSSVWKHVSYRLSNEDIRSLQVFLYLAKPLEKKCLADSAFTLSMMRWRQKETALASQFG
jgi:predicted solute-binding protein